MPEFSKKIEKFSSVIQSMLALLKAVVRSVLVAFGVLCFFMKLANHSAPACSFSLPGLRHGDGELLCTLIHHDSDFHWTQSKINSTCIFYVPSHGQLLLIHAHTNVQTVLQTYMFIRYLYCVPLCIPICICTCFVKVHTCLSDICIVYLSVYLSVYVHVL